MVKNVVYLFKSYPHTHTLYINDLKNFIKMINSLKNKLSSRACEQHLILIFRARVHQKHLCVKIYLFDSGVERTRRYRDYVLL